MIKSINENLLVDIEEFLEEARHMIDEKVEEEIAVLRNQKGSFDTSLAGIQADQERKTLEKIEEVKRGFLHLLQDLQEAVGILEEESNSLFGEEQRQEREECQCLREVLKKNKIFLPKGNENQDSLYKMLDIPWSVVKSFYTQAFNLLEQDYPKPAALIFEMLTLLSSGNYDFWMGLGLARKKQGELKAAIAAFRFCSSLFPDKIEPLIAEAEVCVLQKDPENAATLLPAIEALHSKLPEQNPRIDKAIDNLKRGLIVNNEAKET